jgi:hypothetical protein
LNIKYEQNNRKPMIATLFILKFCFRFLSFLT